MKTWAVVTLYAVGCALGLPAAVLYAQYSPSPDRYFHAYLIVAGFCVSAPSVVIIIRMTLKSWGHMVAQGEVLAEFRPLIRDARAVVDAVGGVVEDLKHQNPGRIIEFIEKIERDGTIPKIVTAIEQVAHKVTATLGRGRAEGEVAVPLTPAHPDTAAHCGDDDSGCGGFHCDCRCGGCHAARHGDSGL